MKDISEDMPEHGDAFYNIRNKYPNLVDFSASIAPTNLPSDFKISALEMIHYPSSQGKIEEIIANRTGLDRKNIVAGYGLTSIIYAVYSMFQRGKAVLSEPIFSEHRKAAESSSINVVRLPLKVMQKNPGIIRDYMPDIVSINSPVNPTGEYLAYDTISIIAEKLMAFGIFLFLDEAFVDFVSWNRRIDYVDLIERYPNTIVGRSMSKISGFAGFRLGYSVSSPEIANRIRRRLIPWTVPKFYTEHMDEILNYSPNPEKIGELREIMINELKGIGLTILGKPEANFISFTIPGKIKGSDFYESMIREGILLRPLENFYGFTSRDFRAAVLDREANEKMVKSAEKVINHYR